MTQRGMAPSAVPSGVLLVQVRRALRPAAAVKRTHGPERGALSGQLFGAYPSVLGLSYCTNVTRWCREEAWCLHVGLGPCRTIPVSSHQSSEELAPSRRQRRRGYPPFGGVLVLSRLSRDL